MIRRSNHEMQNPTERGKAPAGNGGEEVMSGIIRREAFEDLAGAVNTFFNVDTVQLESGKFRGQIDFIAGTGILLYRENYPFRTHLEGELVGNRFGFSIPLQPAKGKFLGESLDDSRISSSVSGETFDHTMEGGYEQMLLLMDHAKLLKLAEQASLSPDALGALLRGRNGKVLKTSPDDVGNLRRKFTRMLGAIRGGGLKMSAADFEKSIFDSILPVIDGGDYFLDRNSASILVRRAMDFAASIDAPVRISDLCMALNASPRTLELAFSKTVGVGPHRFFRISRMNRARTMLLKADSRESRVTDIAEALGFSELGRFSVQYRELFGESPYETLRRSLRVTVAVPWRY
jgi:AraC-like DNA-binding protein